MIDFAAIPWADILPFILIGFGAQLVDGALGMAFGVLSNSLLLLLGLPPAAASAAVHTAETFTSGASGISHALQRNVDWRLFRRLVIPGILGGLTGAWVLTSLDGSVLRPIVLVYLGAIGLYLVWRAARRPQTYRRIRFVAPLGLVAGTLDGAGGGGWGPLATGNLLAQGASPRMVIGTVNAAEFFVTVTIAAALIGKLGLQSFTLAASGLILGGLAAAPLGALLARHVPARPLMIAVGVLLALASLYGLLALMFEPVPAFPRF
ncbi:sulfite exporter TauE/SafE family protein [Sandaracinobacter sp. RS1-74]|uniref:sulfite exporter TauE/SafE family protein n=1 Tax=Sandaracinobacteroides sayramensis TaxID=2913411 RepID=UPI001EDA1609|nr:sulfite exporter TauE/SafE family protein [Sandaracinobacteroides sayramensis]MCG2842108.1 sulfite exporter TauE/SafE family protein [Sandaracinobacteroides sayramensis]